jgi:phenylalanyl-tRNA synthetase beta chain
MKISVNWIKQYLDFELPPISELVEKIGTQLGAVEEIIDLGTRYQGVVVVKVVECRKLEDSDHLNICLIDDGGVTPGVNRADGGLIQVVCGAPNVHAGMFVAWLPPGSTVPSTHGKEPFVLEARTLRDVVSNGMLASAKELALGDSHDGLFELDGDHQPGADFAPTYGLDDTIIDIENKMFTHRPDCFGQLGVAREIAGILGHKFTSPAWYTLQPTFAVPNETTLSLEVQNEIPSLVPRFTAIALDNVQIKTSPVWLQVALVRVGLRPINNIVDLTNYYMLLTGQPLHAYDYHKVKALSRGDTAVLTARNPRPNERLALLSGKTIDPRPEAIVIATDQTIIGLGGVMGGIETEVDSNTTAIILECASFDMYSIRRTSMAHGIFSDAVTRFNKGQSPLQNLAVLIDIVRVTQEITGARVASALIDNTNLPPETQDRGALFSPIHLTSGYINDRLGLSLSAETMMTLLQNVEFAVEFADGSLTVKAPFWRTDIELREDIVEEVGRLYGFDKLPLELPLRPIIPASKDALLELKQTLRTILSQAGANEVLTYSFVHGKLLERVGQDKALAYKLGNALSPDLQYYRLSLTPSLLDKIHANVKAGYDQFGLFELGKAHTQKHIDTESGIPLELDRLAYVFAADQKAQQHFSGAAYYQARKYLMNLLAELGLATLVKLRPLQPESYDEVATANITYYEPARSATIMIGDTVLGEIGEYRSAVRKSLKLPDFCAGFELDLQVLLASSVKHKSYVSVPRFPAVSQDICLRVSADLSYEELYQFVWHKVAKVQPPNTRPTLGPVDIYQRPDDAEHKQITLRLTIASYDKTLTDHEVSQLLDSVVVAAHAKFAAERV